MKLGRRFLGWSALAAGVVWTGWLSLAVAQTPGRWATGAPAPSARSEIALAELAGKVYVVGGFSREGELEIYEAATDRWSRGAPIPRALHHAAAVGSTGSFSCLAAMRTAGLRSTRSMNTIRPPTAGELGRLSPRHVGRSQPPCSAGGSTW